MNGSGARPKISLEHRKKYTIRDLAGVPAEERLKGMLASEGEFNIKEKQVPPEKEMLDVDTSEGDYEEDLVPHGSVAARQGRSTAEESLKERNRTHTKEKPFQCETCSYSASRKSELRKHVRVHTGEKPFKCNMCSYSCSYSSHLTRHTRTHTGEKPFKCKFCSASFTTCSILKNHMMTHTGEKPFKCDRCFYASPRKSDLVRHMKTHTGERPFKCEICSKGFSQRWNLENHHLRTHTDKIPFKCEGCSHTFATCDQVRKDTDTHTTNTCKHRPITTKRTHAVPETEADISFPSASSAQVELFSLGGGALRNIPEEIPLQLGTPLPSVAVGSMMEHWLRTPVRRPDNSSGSQSLRSTSSLRTNESSLPSTIDRSGNQTFWNNLIPTPPRRPEVTFIEADDLPTDDEIREFEPPQSTAEYDIYV